MEKLTQTTGFDSMETMKLFSLDETLYEAVSHDPGLKKKVLTRDPLPHIRHISHIILHPGDNASEHTHADDVEGFYCIRGNAEFLIKGQKVFLRKGQLLLIEPGEVHSIPKINEDTELLYFRVAK